MGLWKQYAGNMPVGVVAAWTAAIVLGWPLMLAAVLAEKLALRRARLS